MTPLRSDTTLYTLMTDILLPGLCGGYVDNILRAGDSDLQNSLAKRTIVSKWEKTRISSLLSAVLFYLTIKLCTDKSNTVYEEA